MSEDSTKIQSSAEVAHGRDCPAFHSARISIGTPDPNGPQWVPLGQTPLPAGTVEFRDRVTNTLLASMSARTGTQLVQTVGACKVVVTPDRLTTLVKVEVWSNTSDAAPDRSKHRTVIGPYTTRYPEVSPYSAPWNE